MRKRAMWVVVVLLAIIGTLAIAKALAAEVNAGDQSLPCDKALMPPNGVHANLEVLVNGRPVWLIAHNGKDYLPVPKLGSEYEIRVTNRGHGRITAIVAVDGLSVITSEKVSDHQPGYVVEASDRLVVKGWRRDLDTVAAFTFEERERSYAFSLGHMEDLGTIKLIAIEEAKTTPLPVLNEILAVAKGTDAGVGDSGTGRCRDIDSSVIEVPFKRGAARQTITIYYDTPEALLRLGIPVEKLNPVPKVSGSPLITLDR